MSQWLLLVDTGLLQLLVAACLFVAFGRTALSVPGAKPTAKKRSTTSSSIHSPVPRLDSGNLYYGHTRWPQYEPRFNLRLAVLCGPVLRVDTGPQNLLAKLFQQLNRFLSPTWSPSDHTILINSLAGDDGTLKKLLNSCASRETSIVAGNYLSRGRRIVLQPYGPDWARHRKAFASLLTREKIKNQWTKALHFEAMVMVDRIAELISDESSTEMTLVDETNRFTASSVLQITYSRRARTPMDPILEDLKKVSKNIANAFMPGNYWVERFPLLEYIPALLSPWKRRLEADHKFESELFGSLLADVEDKLAHSTTSSETDVVIPAEECAAARLINLAKEDQQLDRDHMAYLAAGLFEAGTETTAMTLNTFLLAAACYPACMKRAQAELDDHMRTSQGVEPHKVPTFDDLEHLPLLAGLVREALRLTPTGSSGVGHTPTSARPTSLAIHNQTSNDPSFMLHVSPSTTVLASIYGLHHDAATYRDPWRFDPGRWLDAQGCLASGNTGLDHTHAGHAFGYGRRICPGSALASYSLSMAVALLLWCFDFELTRAAGGLCEEMERQVAGEYERWEDVFGSGGARVVERERAYREDYEDEGDRVGKVLIDAYVTFNLGKEQLAQCVRLRPRRDGNGLTAVRDALSAI